MKSRGGLSPDKYLSEEQWQALQACLSNGSRREATDKLIVELLCYSGLRASELCALNLGDLPQAHGKPCLWVRDGKGNVARVVDIPESLVKSIQHYVERYQLTTGPLLQNCYGERIIYRTVYEKIKRLGRQAGFRLHPHMLRHTYLTRLYNVEHDLRFVQDQAGHADPATTAIYAKTNNAARRRQVEQL